MSWKKQYPPEEGWIRAEFTMKAATPLGVDEIKKLAAWGRDVETLEFGPMRQNGKRVTVIFREPAKAAEAGMDVVQIVGTAGQQLGGAW